MAVTYFIQPSSPLCGEIQVPGDKSISHRVLMLGALSHGQTHVNGFLAGTDCLATLKALQNLGVQFNAANGGPLNSVPLDPFPTSLQIEGVGLKGLKCFKAELDLGNSGTSLRLLTGILAGQDFSSTVTGDASLRRRPMSRIVKPLRQMGAHIEMTNNEYPPLKIEGGKDLTSIEYTLPIASAQVKSCLLFAGLYASGNTQITEPVVTRDHTERLLKNFGAQITKKNNVICLSGDSTLIGQNIEIPGDISSAIFFIIAALISPNSELLIKNVGINPTRIGAILILKSMGARILFLNEHVVSGEPVADILVRSSALKGIIIESQWISLAIDEFPALFIAAACATGTTILRNASELRTKESDRIKGMAGGLRCLGISVEEYEDGLSIMGGKFTSGKVDSFNDHRLAMAFAIAGSVADDEIIIKNCDNVVTSFPNFPELASKIGINIEVRSEP